jgi:hypothetical protein
LFLNIPQKAEYYPPILTVSRKHSAAEIEALIVLSLFGLNHSEKFPSAFGGYLLTLNTPPHPHPRNRIEKRRDLPPTI